MGGGVEVRADGGQDGPDETGPVGPFPSWGALYATVIAWALIVVVLLWLFGSVLNVPAAAP